MKLFQIYRGLISTYNNIHKQHTIYLNARLKRFEFYKKKKSTVTKKYTKKNDQIFDNRPLPFERILFHFDTTIRSRDIRERIRGATDSEWRLDFQETPWLTFFPRKYARRE